MAGHHSPRPTQAAEGAQRSRPRVLAASWRAMIQEAPPWHQGGQKAHPLDRLSADPHLSRAFRANVVDVRRVVGAILLTMIAVVFTADPFCCADGCTNGPHSPVTTTPSCCSLCNSSVTVPTVTAIAKVVHAWWIVDLAKTTALSLLLTRIDHPPRLV
jgi:hypothetical protein